nr:alpha/beta hydrolase [uncultured Cellulosilyticum sp.]
MNKEIFKIENIPAILWGNHSDKIYLYIHGKCGCKEEAEAFASIVCNKGWQVLSIDLPEHGERKQEVNRFNPWTVVPELQTILTYVKKGWKHIGLRANSIGAWFSMQAYENESFERCLFVSPILDMSHLISNMMHWASVSEEMLQEKQEITTDFGETLSWRYFTYANNHPISKWHAPTAVLYGERDNMTERYIVEDFCKRYHVQLDVMENGEHWFHTPEQLDVLKLWEEENS